jgi:hypothetical protein|tara:strand:+ start:75 stop:203 length:129 start_codon:yes stop_codon:yes gene_type:complete
MTILLLNPEVVDSVEVEKEMKELVEMVAKEKAMRDNHQELKI